MKNLALALLLIIPGCTALASPQGQAVVTALAGGIFDLASAQLNRYAGHPIPIESVPVECTFENIPETKRMLSLCEYDYSGL